MKLLISRLIVVGTFLLPVQIRAQQYLAPADAPKPQAIPFQLKGGFLIEVQGGIGPLEGLRFVLDTGATRSIVDRRIANHFSAVRHPGKLLNFDGSASVDWAEFPNVHFGPIKVSSAPMTVAQLTKYSELVGNADAIIGLDLLSAVGKMDIFYDSGTVVLTPRDSKDQGRSQKERHYIAVLVMVQGHPLQLLLDTGMNAIVLYEDRIRKRLPSLRFTHQSKNAHMGRLQGKTAQLSDFRLSGPGLDVGVFLMNGPREDILRGIDGYLGIGTLKAKRIELDFAGKTLRWQ